MSQVAAPFERPVAPAPEQWGHEAGAAGPSLGIGTQLVKEPWASLNTVLVNLYPSCGEAIAIWAPRASPSEVDSSDSSSNWAELSEDYRDAQNFRRATTRSKGRMRRYMVHNRLVKMWVLTFTGQGLHGEDGYRQAQAETRAFIKRLRRDFYRGKNFPYLWSIEPHPGGHGWHVNLMLQNVFIDKGQFQRGWQNSRTKINGNVWYTDFTKDSEDWLGRPIGGKRGKSAPAGSRTAAKRAASYASKYIGKDLDEDSGIPDRAHRYEVAQGYQPVPVQRRFLSFTEAVTFITSHRSFGSLEWFSRSQDWDDWDGPPVQCFRFDPPPK